MMPMTDSSGSGVRGTSLNWKRSCPDGAAAAWFLVSARIFPAVAGSSDGGVSSSAACASRVSRSAAAG
jgi:hypothetical protein